MSVKLERSLCMVNHAAQEGPLTVAGPDDISIATAVTQVMQLIKAARATGTAVVSLSLKQGTPLPMCKTMQEALAKRGYIALLVLSGGPAPVAALKLVIDVKRSKPKQGAQA